MSYKHDWGMKTHLNDLKNSKKNILSIFELFNIFKIDFEINEKPANFEIFENFFSSFGRNSPKMQALVKKKYFFRKLQKISYLLVVFNFFVAQKLKKLKGGPGGVPNSDESPVLLLRAVVNKKFLFIQTER